MSKTIPYLKEAFSEIEDDAARYQWLEERIDFTCNDGGYAEAKLRFEFGLQSSTPSTLREAIDAAMDDES